jgi:DNA (cytosine-5)-methyltransferase 1
MLRVIREVEPQWVVGENVRGLLNWNGGMVFHEVCADLENIGYEVQAFIIPASGINAPHQRERLWIVANSRHNAERKTASSITNEGEQSSIIHTSEQSRNKSAIFNNGFCDLQRDAAHTDNTRSNNGMQSNGEWKENDEQRRGQSQSEHWENGINGNVTNSQNYGRKTDERINNGTKYKSNDRGTIRNIFNTDGKQRNAPNSDLHGFDECNGNDEINASERGFNALNDIDQSNGIGNIADSNGERLEGLRKQKEGHSKLHRGYDGLSKWQNFPTQSPVCSGDDGISHGLDNITFPKWRNESIKGYGNAVVPQVVYRIFKTIEYIQNLNDNTQSKN